MATDFMNEIAKDGMNEIAKDIMNQTMTDLVPLPWVFSQLNYGQNIVGSPMTWKGSCACFVPSLVV